MKLILLMLLAVLLPFAAAQQGATQQSGVKDGSTWQDNGGKFKVTVTVRAQTNGNLSIEYTDSQGNTGSTPSGTPAPGGGCSESPAVTVGSKVLRIRNGRVQMQMPAGHWTDLHQPGFAE